MLRKAMIIYVTLGFGLGSLGCFGLVGVVFGDDNDIMIHSISVEGIDISSQNPDGMLRFSSVPVNRTSD